MRVHFRGIVLGVGVLLSVVIVISVFNAFDSPAGRMRTRSRNALSADSEEEAGQSPSRTSPRSSTRLRPQGGARGARAGGPGARAGGAGGPRAAGAGARAGGLGGPRGRAGRMGGAAAARGGDIDEEEEEEIEIDETPSEEVEEEEPRGRAGFAARNRQAGPPARGRASDDDDEEILATGASARRSAASRRQESKRKAQEEEEEEEEEEKEEKKEEKEEEKPTEPPKKKEPPYPEWWKQAYLRSAVSGAEDQFVGDQPFYQECPTFEAGSSNLKIKRYGFVEPPHFLKNSKNPCWFEWNGKKDLIKCVPYFYIAGVPKSGTADLLRRVQGHPNVMEGGSTAYYWWDRLRYGASRSMKYTREAKRSDDVVQLKEYAKTVVGKQGKNLTKEILYGGKSESIFGDASPTYLTENTQWDVFEANDGCSEPRVIPASFIRHIFPDARIIILLRDPVDRLYSRFLANVPYVYEYENLTSTLFHTFVTQAVQSYRQCFATLSVRHCAYNTSLFTSSVVRLSEGMYSVFLEDWFRVFPREQILIFKFEDYVLDVQGHISKVFTHLSVDPVDAYSAQKLAELPVVRKGRVREEAGFMLPETVALLKEFYTPFNLKLADMLQDDKWLFPRDDSLLTAAVAAPVPVVGMNIAVPPPAPPPNENIAPGAPNEPPKELEKPVEKQEPPETNAVAGETGGEKELPEMIEDVNEEVL